MTEITLRQAAERYLSSYDQRGEGARSAVEAFVRWYGADTPLSRLSPQDVARYVEELGSGDEARRRAEELRAFLSRLRQWKLIDQSLAQHVRLPRSRTARQTATSSDLPAIEMTAEGYAALQQELEALKAQRPLIAEEIRRAALDKDFRENAPLQAAREKQSHLETRIRELESMLRRAVIVDDRGDGQRVQLGSTVEVRNLDTGALHRYTVVGPAEADTKAGKISSASPVGRALLDRRQGDEVEVEVPAGRLRLRIERIE
ncbi:MAG TPA: transcription elongation factor GreA [Dehalococcoidia bacterium]|nr:transcription elongation factor GreA [Dehalococcoidia bacterium]